MALQAGIVTRGFGASPRIVLGGFYPSSCPTYTATAVMGAQASAFYSPTPSPRIIVSGGGRQVRDEGGGRAVTAAGGGRTLTPTGGGR